MIRNHHLLWLSAATLFVLGAFACGAESSTRSGINSDRLLVEAEVHAGEYDRVWIPWENRSDLARDLGLVTLDIPADALAHDTTITLSLGAADFTDSPAGPVIVVGPDDLEFAAPVTLELPYREGDVLRPVRSLAVEAAAAEHTVLYPTQVEPWVTDVYVSITGAGRFQPAYETCGAGSACDAGADCVDGFCQARHPAEDCSELTGMDLDVDGDAGCMDYDCRNAPECEGTNFEYCEDGVDNNGDGLVDCDDPWCQTHRMRCLLEHL